MIVTHVGFRKWKQPRLDNKETPQPILGGLLPEVMQISPMQPRSRPLPGVAAVFEVRVAGTTLKVTEALHGSVQILTHLAPQPSSHAPG